MCWEFLSVPFLNVFFVKEIFIFSGDLQCLYMNSTFFLVIWLKWSIFGYSLGICFIDFLDFDRLLFLDLFWDFDLFLDNAMSCFVNNSNLSLLIFFKEDEVFLNFFDAISLLLAGLVLSSNSLLGKLTSLFLSTLLSTPKKSTADTSINFCLIET